MPPSSTTATSRLLRRHGVIRVRVLGIRIEASIAADALVAIVTAVAIVARLRSTHVHQIVLVVVAVRFVQHLLLDFCYHAHNHVLVQIIQFVSIRGGLEIVMPAKGTPGAGLCLLPREAIKYSRVHTISYTKSFSLTLLFINYATLEFVWIPREQQEEKAC